MQLRLPSFTFQYAKSNPDGVAMKRRTTFVAFLTIGCLSTFAWLVADQPPQTFRQIIDNIPDPEIATLAKRGAPGPKDARKPDAFLELLKLRDNPNQAAQQALESLVKQYADLRSTDIHGFAAAQALFALDNDRGHRFLERHVSRDNYPSIQAIMYTTHWEMKEPQRSEFVKRYLLKPTTDEVELIASLTRTKVANEYFLFVEAKNSGKSAIHFVHSPEVLPFTAIVTDKRGMVLPIRTSAHKVHPSLPTKTEIQPGQSLTFRTSIFANKSSAGKYQITTNSKECTAASLGEYRVHIVLQQRSGPQQKTDEGFWQGRVISKPLRYDLRSP